MARLGRDSDYHDEITRQEIYETSDRKSIEDGITELERRRDAESDPAKQAEYQEEIDNTREYLNNATRKGTKGTKPKSRTFGSARAMSKNHDTAMAHIEKNFPELHNHLKAFMRIGETSWYKPDGNIRWDIS